MNGRPQQGLGVFIESAYKIRYFMWVEGEGPALNIFLTIGRVSGFFYLPGRFSNVVVCPPFCWCLTTMAVGFLERVVLLYN